MEGSTCAHVLERLMFQNVLESGIPPDVCDTFFSRLFFSIAGDNVSFRTAWKNYGVPMSWKEESLRISCEHFCFRMSSRLFQECSKTMVSRRSEGKNLCGCLRLTYVSADCFSLSGNAVCFRTAWKNDGVRMSRTEESLRISCKHFCLTMSSRLFQERSKR